MNKGANAVGVSREAENPDRQHGAGLGLSLAAQIAEIHGSSLEFDSKEGVGTVVKIGLKQGRKENDE